MDIKIFPNIQPVDQHVLGKIAGRVCRVIVESRGRTQEYFGHLAEEVNSRGLLEFSDALDPLRNFEFHPRFIVSVLKGLTLWQYTIVHKNSNYMLEGRHLGKRESTFWTSCNDELALGDQHTISRNLPKKVYLVRQIDNG